MSVSSIKINRKVFTTPPNTSVNKNSQRKSSPMPWLLYLHLSGSAFSVSFADPNKQLFNIKPVFKFPNHGVSV